MTNSQFHTTTILQIATCLVIVCFMWYLNYARPTEHKADPDVVMAIRQANSEQRKALVLQREEAAKTQEYLMKRDSLNEIKLKQTTSEIQKNINSTNEKISNMRNYNSVELVRAFAEIPPGK